MMDSCKSERVRENDGKGKRGRRKKTEKKSGEEGRRLKKGRGIGRLYKGRKAIE